MSSDLTKGSFGHSSIFYVFKLPKRLKFHYFSCSYTRVKLILTCNAIKDANISDITK